MQPIGFPNNVLKLYGVGHNVFTEFSGYEDSRFNYAALYTLRTISPILHVVASLMAVSLSWINIEVLAEKRKLEGESLRMSFSAVDAISAILTTVSLSLGKSMNRPLLLLPWLVITAEGLLVRQGPCLLVAILRLAKPNFGMGMAFVLSYIAVYCEQLALWLILARQFLATRPEWINARFGFGY